MAESAFSSPVRKTIALKEEGRKPLSNVANKRISSGNSIIQPTLVN